jgi:hypothetical protein
VKPDALEGVATLADREFENRHLTRAHQHRPANFGDDAGCLAGLQFIEASGILAVFVTEGKMVKQVFRGLDTLCFEHLRDVRANTAYKLHLIA